MKRIAPAQVRRSSAEQSTDAARKIYSIFFFLGEIVRIDFIYNEKAEPFYAGNKHRPRPSEARALYRNR